MEIEFETPNERETWVNERSRHRERNTARVYSRPRHHPMEEEKRVSKRKQSVMRSLYAGTEERGHGIKYDGLLPRALSSENSPSNF